MGLSEQELNEIRHSFKRCGQEVVDAIVRYRTESDESVVPMVVCGIIERYLPPEHEQSLMQASDDLKLAEDLGIDSLTMLEIVLGIEEALDIRIDNEELRNVRTLGDVKNFMKLKFDKASASGGGKKSYSREDIVRILPQQPPFLFLNSAEIDNDSTTAIYQVDASEYFFEGHFKGDPVLPACIVFEALGQAGCLWVLENAPARSGVTIKDNQVLFASMEGAHFHKRVKPGETLTLKLKLKHLREPLVSFEGLVLSGEEKVAVLENLVLAFGDMDQVAGSEESAS